VDCSKEKSVKLMSAAAVYERLLTTAVMAGDINQCCGIVRRGLQEFPDPSAWIAGSANTLSKVVSLGVAAARIDERNAMLPGTIPVLSHVSAELGMWENALTLCEKMRKPPDPGFLAGLMHRRNFSYVYDFCAERDWKIDMARAVTLLGNSGAWLEALTIARAEEARSPWSDRFSCGVLIPHLMTGGSWVCAMKVFAETICAGALVDQQLIVHTVRASARGGDWQSTLMLAGALHKASMLQEISDAPDAPLVYRDIALSTPHWNAALRVLRLAVSCGVPLDQQLVGTTIAKCDAAGQWRCAAAVYDLAVRSQCITQLGSASYSAVIRSFHALSQWERAVEAISWMSRVGEAAAVAGMTEMVVLSEKAGQWEVALQLGSELVRTHAVASSTAYLSLMHACQQGQRWAAACTLFHHMARDFTVSPHPIALCTAIQTCGRARQWSAALGLVSYGSSLQPRFVVPPLALRLALSACVDAARWHESLVLIDTMQRTGLPMDTHSRKLGLWASALSGSWCMSLQFFSELSVAQRTAAEHKVVRSSATAAGPLATAMVLKHLHSLR
jgi:hypothetical protein